MKNKDRYSKIYDGLIQKDLNPFIEFIIRFMFRKINLDEESRQRLVDSASRGALVYASFQSTNVSLLILYVLLKRKGIEPPVFALEYNPFLLQHFDYVMERISKYFTRFFSAGDASDINDTIFIEDQLKQGRPILTALLSRRFFVKRYRDIRHDTLLRLVEIQQRMDRPILLVPQMIFWNHNPERTDMPITDFHATGDRGLISAWLSITKSISHAFVRILEPINLKEEIGEAPGQDSSTIALRIRNKLLDAHHRERRVVLGPVIKTEQEMLEKVLYHDAVLDTVRQLAGDDPDRERKLRKQAIRHYREIAATFNIAYVRMLEYLLSHVFKKIFNTIYYNEDELRMIRETLQKGPLVITPCHKSHVDYLLISYLFHRNRIIAPHICSGINLAFFPMNIIFRGAGAFFMRRSFKGQQLYSAVFKQYVKTLIAEGYIIEIFIEGGRSRTGKLVYPKVGMLNIIIEALQEGYHTDIFFAPIGINYDRVLEETSYFDELKGKEKKKESALMLVESAKLLKREYGNVYMMFNRPFSLAEWLAHNGNSQNVPVALANHIVDKISEVTMVTPIALVTTTVLLSSVKGFVMETLYANIEALHRYLVYSGVTIAPVLSDTAALRNIINQVIAAYRNDGILDEVESPERIAGESCADYYIIKEDRRPQIAFYKNTIVQNFIPLAYCSLVLLAASPDGASIDQDGILHRYRAIRDLFLKEFLFMADDSAAKNDVQRVLAYLADHDLITTSPEGAIAVIDTACDELRFYARIVREYAEAYSVVLGSFIEPNGFRAYRHEFITTVRRNGVKKYHLGELQYAESLSMPYYINAVQHMIDCGLVAETVFDKKKSELVVVDREGIRERRDLLVRYLKCM